MGAIVALLGCGTVRVAVHARPATRWGEVASRPIPVALFIDSSLETAKFYADAPAGAAKIACEFDLGEGLTKTVEDAVRATFPQTRRVEACRCTDTPILLCARMETPPDIQVRWVQYLFSVGGGATANLAVRVDATDCASGIKIPHVLTGYGSADQYQELANYPGEEEFRPAIDAALSEISVKLDRILAGLEPPLQTQRPENKDRSKK